MPEIPIGAAILGSALIGGGASIFGASKAADAQKDAAAKASALQLQMFQQALAQGKELFGQGKDIELSQLDKTTGALQPFIDQGTDVMGPLKRLTTPGADMTAALEKTPGYEFALSQGEKGITNQATMGGLSGNALRAGGAFASGLASNTWSSVVDKLIAQLGIGKDAATSAGSFRTATGTAIGNQSVGLANNVMANANAVGGKIGDNTIGAGNATAGADIASANAVSGATGNVSNALMLNALTGGKLFGSSNPGAWGGNASPVPFANAPFSGGAP